MGYEQVEVQVNPVFIKLNMSARACAQTHYRGNIRHCIHNVIIYTYIPLIHGIEV